MSPSTRYQCVGLTLGPRGIWGSFGAIVVLITLVMDPFAQQIVTFESCQRPDYAINATTPRSNWYGQTGIEVLMGLDTLPIDMQLAISAGLFGQDQDLNVIPTCATGNCTFDPFYTIAWCSSCSEISDAVCLSSRQSGASNIPS